MQTDSDAISSSPARDTRNHDVADASWLARNRIALLIALIAALAFVPFVFLRYEYHDSWALLYYLKWIEVFNVKTTCLETGAYHAMTGRFMMVPIICGMLKFGPVIDLVWIPKLLALLLLFASGGILFCVFRRVGVGPALASAALLSLLLLPGMVLLVVWMATNPIAYGAFASVSAGYIWLRYLRHPKHPFATRLALSICVFLLLVFSFNVYQSVALLFFAPLMIEILFSEQEKGIAQLVYPVLAVATFALAAVAYVIIHKILLYDFRYFFLSEAQVQFTLTDDRNLSITGLLDPRTKLSFFAEILVPRVFTLWFTSESSQVAPVAATAVGAVAAIAVVLFAWKAGNLWRVLALLLIAGCFFGPFLVSANLSNGLYTNERVKVFMQMPIVLTLWWLVHLLATSFAQSRGRVLAGVLAAAVLIGPVALWLTVLRARVIPNYMELKHVEYRLKEAIRQDAQEIYIIKADDGHLRRVLGDGGGREELGRITSFYFPQHMVFALMAQMEGSKFKRKVVAVDANKGDSVMEAPGRMIIDMRRFP